MSITNTLGKYNPEETCPMPAVTQWEGQGGTARGWEAQAGEMGFVKLKK